MNEVEHQPYYHRNGVEVKDVIRNVLDFFGDDLSGYEASCMYNIMKYLMRYKFKGKPKEDLDKAKTYLEFLKEELNDK